LDDVGGGQAQVRGIGWPTGVVLENRDESRPRPTNDGIVASVIADIHAFDGRRFAYWALTKGGDFYTLMSLSEDNRDENRAGKTIYFDTRIMRAAEALLHCANLDKTLGIQPNAQIDMTVRYGGLKGRTLAPTSTESVYYGGGENSYEDEVSIPAIAFKLGAVRAEMVELVKKLCAPLFVIFDYAELPDNIYRKTVTDFVNGKIR
jgi:hypothetical protein